MAVRPCRFPESEAMPRPERCRLALPGDWSEGWTVRLPEAGQEVLPGAWLRVLPEPQNFRKRQDRRELSEATQAKMPAVRFPYRWGRPLKQVPEKRLRREWEAAESVPERKVLPVQGPYSAWNWEAARWWR